jgi:CBS domain-containing membrane protein
VKWPERLRSCLGALLGIAFTGGSMLLLLGPSASIPLLVAPMGASAVLLFAVPASPLAQPWSIIGGNLVSATVGVACATWIADPIDAAALAVAVAICAMFALRCVHPPSGAVALTAVLGGPPIHALGFRFVLEPIALQSFALLTAAIVFHALTGHRYPHAAGQNAAKAQGNGQPAANPGFTRADLDAVLARRGELLDIDPADLESVVNEAQMRAYVRTFDELTCADIMSRPVASILATTTAATAADLLSRRAVKALPVVDTTQRVIGIVTRADLTQYGATGTIASLLRLPARWLASDEATRTAGALMTTDVCTIDAATPITELVPIFANFGHHHIPVLDAQERLVGMITQADVISGLYRQTQQQRRQAA